MCWVVFFLSWLMVVLSSCWIEAPIHFLRSCSHAPRCRVLWSKRLSLRPSMYWLHLWNCYSCRWRWLGWLWAGWCSTDHSPAACSPTRGFSAESLLTAIVKAEESILRHAFVPVVHRHASANSADVPSEMVGTCRFWQTPCYPPSSGPVL